MTDDIERTLKEFLSSPESQEGIHLSADDVRTMLDRLGSYRERLRTKQGQFDKKLGVLQRELADLRQSIQWARERLDAEGLITHYSYMDQIETALLMKAIEQKRGRIVAQRMFWGDKPSQEISEETLGVLKAAIEEAQRERDRWYRYLGSQRKSLDWRWSTEWSDWDGAEYELGVMLGIFNREAQPFQTVKHLFWTDNPVGNALHECLEKLVAAGIFEGQGSDGDPETANTRFRWNREFKCVLEQPVR